MPWPELLVLVRHAESEGNVRTVEERAAYGVSTHAYRLTERGRRQAEITGRYLRKSHGEFDVRYTSYYARAKETMNLLCPGAASREDPRLAEAQRGVWHTYSEEDMRRCFPLEFERKKREGLYHYRPPGGENWPDIELRVWSFLSTLARDCGGQRVLIVVHGHWLILFQRLIHHFSIEEAVRRYRSAIFENASVTVYRGRTIGGKPRLELETENFVPWKDEIIAPDS